MERKCVESVKLSPCASTPPHSIREDWHCVTRRSFTETQPPQEHLVLTRHEKRRKRAESFKEQRQPRHI